ncbi:DUF6098 family protein [Amycolatopsis sp. NPDC047767]|uniref:DUF6098 family protein n=1 Tax=Amycolatopsis sp. NPDC047767 TaxID=3156765 RepID=UPI00345524B7
MRLWLARRLYDYEHLRGPGVRPWVLRGLEIARGPGNEPLIAGRSRLPAQGYWRNSAGDVLNGARIPSWNRYPVPPRAGHAGYVGEAGAHETRCGAPATLRRGIAAPRLNPQRFGRQPSATGFPWDRLRAGVGAISLERSLSACGHPKHEVRRITDRARQGHARWHRTPRHRPAHHA